MNQTNAAKGNVEEQPSESRRLVRARMMILDSTLEQDAKSISGGSRYLAQMKVAFEDLLVFYFKAAVRKAIWVVPRANASSQDSRPVRDAGV